MPPVASLISGVDEALILESRILALNAPGSRTLSAFRRWFNHRTPVLWGRDESLYEERDLVALAPVKTDRINVFLQTHLGWLFRGEAVGVGEAAGRNGMLFYYQQHYIQFMGRVIAVILSAVLLVGAITCLLLNKEASDAVRVGTIVLFTCLFAMTVGLLTNARRAEIFAATAA